MARQGQVKLVKMLLDHGASVDIRSNVSTYLPLLCCYSDTHVAVDMCCGRTTKVTLKFGVV